jgi:hypothetical protein
MRVGVVFARVVPSPSWPLSLAPQHQRVPSVLTAQLCFVPSESVAMHLFDAGADTQVDESVLPAPSE